MIDGNKARHMTGCALYMHERARDYGLDPDKMYVLGLLHDIGYLDNAREHEAEGQRLCKKLGLPEVFYYSIGHHSANLENMSTQETFMPDELILLIEADLSVTAKGKICGFRGRLEDINRRYGNCYTGLKNTDYIINFCKKKGIRHPEDFFREAFRGHPGEKK